MLLQCINDQTSTDLRQGKEKHTFTGTEVQKYFLVLMKFLQGMFKMIEGCGGVDGILGKIDEIKECAHGPNSALGNTRDSNDAAKELFYHFLVFMTDMLERLEILLTKLQMSWAGGIWENILSSSCALLRAVGQAMR